ncbi:hypothetical protein GCM10017687_26100 [Streptomyces echinatus]
MPNSGRYYRPHVARRRTDARRPRPKPGKIGGLRAAGRPPDHVTRRWSSEQICHGKTLDRETPAERVHNLLAA